MTPQAAPPAPLDAQLCFALYSASRAVTGLYRDALADSGLTYPQYLVLLCLWQDDGLTVSELGQRLHLDSGTLSPLLKRLEASGRVHRARSADDARVVRVHLTDAGAALRAEGARIQQCLATGLDLTPAEARTLHDLATRVAAQADADPTA